jgi:hypothetical protein
MTSGDDDFDALIDALRSDLPSARDERRVRRRLVAAGVGLATGFVSSAATATASAAGSRVSALLLQKLGALSWTAKVGLAGVAAAVALPAASYLASTAPNDPLATARVPSPATGRSPGRPAVVPSKAPHPTASIVAPSTEDEPAPQGLESAALPRHGSVAPEPKPSAPRGALAVDPRERESEEDPLREETELIERALYALKLGDREGARRTLELHARRFPNGLLTRERERALVRANSEEDPSRPASR